MREIAEGLGWSLESLRHWVKQTRIDVGEAPGLTSDEREELRRLRREDRLLREEREILKKASPRVTGDRTTEAGVPHRWLAPGPECLGRDPSAAGTPTAPGARLGSAGRAPLSYCSYATACAGRPTAKSSTSRSRGLLSDSPLRQRPCLFSP